MKFNAPSFDKCFKKIIDNNTMNFQEYQDIRRFLFDPTENVAAALYSGFKLAAYKDKSSTWTNP